MLDNAKLIDTYANQIGIKKSLGIKSLENVSSVDCNQIAVESPAKYVNKFEK